MKTSIFKKNLLVVIVTTYFFLFGVKTSYAQQVGKFYGTIPAQTNLVIKNGNQILPVYWGCTPTSPYNIVSQAIAPNESQTEVFTWIHSRYFTGAPLAADAIIVTHFEYGGQFGTLSKGDSVLIIKWKK